VVEATQLLGNQAGLTIDTIHRNVLLTGTNVMYCPKGTSPVTDRADLDATAKLTVDMVKKVVAWLKKNNAPKIDGSYVAIIHPYVAYDLMSDPAWIDAHKYAQPENIYEGEIGKIGGVRFVETSEAKSFGGGKYATLFMGANAYGVTEIDGGGLRTIIKQLGSGGTSDPLDQRATVGWKAMTTAEILVPQYLVRVESGSGYPTAAEEN
jgi:N4-gp56 family major capsid protein